MKKARLHVGTSGWAYASWRGTFYPRGLKQSEWLRYYAEHFDCVEVNNSFYRLPERRIVERWAGLVPDTFEFCFKVWRYISHVKKLQDGEDQLEDFLQVIEPAVGKQGPLLLQLPPQLRCHEQRLDEALQRVADADHHHWPLGVEFRHKSWYRPETRAILDKHQAALVLHDKPGSAVREPNKSADFVYLRFHGPRGDYGGSYSNATLQRYAELIKQWLAGGQSVYVFFNNDLDGAAIQNARALREMVGG